MPEFWDRLLERDRNYYNPARFDRIWQQLLQTAGQSGFLLDVWIEANGDFTYGSPRPEEAAYSVRYRRLDNDEIYKVSTRPGEMPSTSETAAKLAGVMLEAELDYLDLVLAHRQTPPPGFVI